MRTLHIKGDMRYIPHLRHSCSRGKGNARRSLNLQSPQPQTAESPSCSTISLAATACPPPRPLGACRDSCPETASACPYGSPSNTGASLSGPCCERKDRERDRERETMIIREKLSILCVLAFFIDSSNTTSG